jgi:DNA-binding NarL/FixJ family response regulator
MQFNTSVGLSGGDLPRSAGDASEAPSSDPPTVLIVDDNDAVLSKARAALSARCVVLGTARDGHSALDAASALAPAVIVLDISMPGMNGFEVARRLREAGSTARLVFLTVHEEEELVAAARNAGAIGYVLKSRLSSDLELAVCEAAAGRPFQSPLDS